MPECWCYSLPVSHVIFWIAGRLLHKILRSIKVVVIRFNLYGVALPDVVLLDRQLLRLSPKFQLHLYRGERTEHGSWCHYSLFWLTLHELSQMGSKWFFLGCFLPAFQSTLGNVAYFRKFSYISWLFNIPWIIITKLFGNKLSLEILWRNYLTSDLKIKSSTCNLAIRWSNDLWLDLKLKMLTCDLTWTEKTYLDQALQ